MTVHSAAGSTISIDASQSAYAAVDLTGTDTAIITAFAALTWTPVGEAEDLGIFGDVASAITFTALANRRVRKMKGTYDAGTLTAKCGSDPADPGQLAMIAAFATDFDYGFKVTLNDKITLAGTPTTLYFGGKVMGKARDIGAVVNVVRQTFPIDINTKIYEAVAT